MGGCSFPNPQGLLQPLPLCPATLRRKECGVVQAVGTADGWVQLFEAAEFQFRQPLLWPSLSLQPLHSASTSGVDFLQWRNEGDVLIAVRKG